MMLQCQEKKFYELRLSGSSRSVRNLSFPLERGAGVCNFCGEISGFKLQT